MSLRIIKAGIFDTIQDLGRPGFQSWGINPGGAMDRFAAQVVNILVGNCANEATIELHFPSSAFLLDEQAMIAIGGADFSATVNGEDVPLWQPILVSKNSVLQFQRRKQGARCYLGVREKLDVSEWLNSASTNTKAASGGVNGRTLQKNDTISLKEKNDYTAHLGENDFVVLPWKAGINWSETPTDRIAVFPGNEWSLLTDDSKNKFLSDSFGIGSLADRMGFRLLGELHMQEELELVSSAVSFGTIQLLPNGELIVLMADHQTTGGYPRIAHVISAHLSALAQKQTGDKIYFRLTDLDHAESLFFQQQQHLSQLQNACKFKLEEFFNAVHRH